MTRGAVDLTGSHARGGLEPVSRRVPARSCREWTCCSKQNHTQDNESVLPQVTRYPFASSGMEMTNHPSAILVSSPGTWHLQRVLNTPPVTVMQKIIKYSATKKHIAPTMSKVCIFISCMFGYCLSFPVSTNFFSEITKPGHSIPFAFLCIEIGFPTVQMSRAVLCEQRGASNLVSVVEFGRGNTSALDAVWTSRNLKWGNQVK
jgi:hypothetical protein